jgi:hypothetical protein
VTTHQLIVATSPGYVDRRRGFKNDIESRVTSGPAVFTANATGTTTTIVGANAAPGTGTNIMRLDDEFKLFNVTTGTLKEETVFRVTGIAVAGSTTVTYTPASAVAPISGDTIRLVGTMNLTSYGEKDRRLLALSVPQARINIMTENDKDYALRVLDDPGSL